MDRIIGSEASPTHSSYINVCLSTHHRSPSESKDSIQGRDRSNCRGIPRKIRIHSERSFWMESYSSPEPGHVVFSNRLFKTPKNDFCLFFYLPNNLTVKVRVLSALFCMRKSTHASKTERKKKRNSTVIAIKFDPGRCCHRLLVGSHAKPSLHHRADKTIARGRKLKNVMEHNIQNARAVERQRSGNWVRKRFRFDG